MLGGFFGYGLQATTTAIVGRPPLTMRGEDLRGIADSFVREQDGQTDA